MQPSSFVKFLEFAFRCISLVWSTSCFTLFLVEGYRIFENQTKNFASFLKKEEKKNLRLKETDPAHKEG